jgi:hypothetical protein
VERRISGFSTLSLNNTPLARSTQVKKGKMETAEAEGGLTRQSRRERAKTTKALKHDSYESDTEDTVHVAAVAPSAPRSKRTGKKLRPKDQIVLIRNRAMAKKRAKQPVITATIAN